MRVQGQCVKWALVAPSTDSKELSKWCFQAQDVAPDPSAAAELGTRAGYILDVNGTQVGYRAVCIWLYVPNYTDNHLNVA